MSKEYYAVVQSNAISHYGVKGQKWGIRRYQNEDGSLTPEGRKRYGYSTLQTVYVNTKTGKIGGHRIRDNYTEKEITMTDREYKQHEKKMAKEATNNMAKLMREMDNSGLPKDFSGSDLEDIAKYAPKIKAQVDDYIDEYSHIYYSQVIEDYYKKNK